MNFKDSPKVTRVYRVAKIFKANPNRKEIYPGSNKPARLVLTDEALRNLSHVWINPSFSRYTDGNWPIIYTAPKASTTYSEVGFHLQNQFGPSLMKGEPKSIDHIRYCLKVKGIERNYFDHTADHSKLCEAAPEGYEFCHTISNQARYCSEHKIAYLKVPSARNIGSPAVPILDDGSISKPYQTQKIIITIEKGLTSVAVNTGKAVRRYRVARVF